MRNVSRLVAHASFVLGLASGQLAPVRQAFPPKGWTEAVVELPHGSKEACVGHLFLLEQSQ